jgi:hypothetical protein
MVISGLILAIISGDEELNALRFYLNRALGIYPLFRCRDNACANTPKTHCNGAKIWLPPRRLKGVYAKPRANPRVRLL